MFVGVWSEEEGNSDGDGDGDDRSEPTIWHCSRMLLIRVVMLVSSSLTCRYSSPATNRRERLATLYDTTVDVS